MKKLILTLLVATSLLHSAPSYSWNRGGNGYQNGYNGYRGGYNNGYRGGYNNNWIAPAIGGLIIGGVVGALAQPYYAPAPIYNQAPPVYYPPVQAPPVYYPPVQAPSAAPAGYRQEQMLDVNCNCYVTVLVPN
jgi:hypothetical protein